MKPQFFHFGRLPQICIHSLIEDEYSKMYIAKEKCECGNSEWIESEIQMFKNIDSPKKVHRCSKCNSVRMADHIAAKYDN